jgi:hypothetical protein
MQLFSDSLAGAFPILAQATPSPAAIQQMTAQMVALGQKYAGWVILVLVASQAFAILGYWLGSKAMAEEESATLGNAFKVWIFLILSSIGVNLLNVVAAAVAGAQSGEATMVRIVVGLASLVFIFAIPMKVYTIGFLRAFGFLILSGLCAGIFVGVVIFGVVLASPGIVKDFGAVVQNLQATVLQQPGALAAPGGAPGQANGSLLPGEAVAGDRSKSIAERGAGINQMFTELANRYKAIPKGDKAAMAEYTAENARYQQTLSRLKADAAAPHPAAPPK